MRLADKSEESRKHLPYLRRSGGMGRSPGMSPDSFVIRHQGSENPEEKSMDVVQEHLGSSQRELLVIDNKMSSPIEPKQIRSGAYGHENQSQEEPYPYPLNKSAPGNISFYHRPPRFLF